MSNNIDHWTEFFQPSATPGILIAEDLKALDFNNYVFPDFNFDPEQDLSRRPDDEMGIIYFLVEKTDFAAWEAVENCP